MVGNTNRVMLNLCQVAWQPLHLPLRQPARAAHHLPASPPLPHHFLILPGTASHPPHSVWQPRSVTCCARSHQGAVSLKSISSIPTGRLHHQLPCLHVAHHHHLHSRCRLSCLSQTSRQN